ncbi:MAG: DUF1269 domain-containing protein [Actinomycetia bacterium]|nr:DUF1269 domain-containing protein [Actinomycetes bacterium]MCP3912229.1 DUF1269 domain-containing protein [Actinomycetes bacterium]MCP4088039.1 DUF1269 domain-containing protein [Actinomycetes bacterium]
MADESPGTLIAIRFDEALKAQECVLAMARVAKAGDVDIDDVAVVIKDENARIMLQQSRDVNAGQGATSGGWLGAIVGIIGGPAGILAGGALGATVGGLWAKLHDVGIDDDHMRGMGEGLIPGEAAMFVLMKSYDIDPLAAELIRFDGLLLESTLSEDESARLTKSLATELPLPD